MNNYYYCFAFYYPGKRVRDCERTEICGRFHFVARFLQMLLSRLPILLREPELASLLCYPPTRLSIYFHISQLFYFRTYLTDY